jgi:hypothetical protein
MTKTICDCGNRISTASFPNRDVYALLAETAYDMLDDPIERPVIEQLFVKAPLVLHCVKCGRLHVNWRDGNVITYFPTPVI